MTYDQLEVEVERRIGETGSRFVADDSLSIIQMHRVGLAYISCHLGLSSLQNNCTVLGVEYETKQQLIT